MAGDVINLMDHLGLRSTDVMGYSMGGFITLRLLMERPHRFGRAIIGGVGENYFSPVTVNVDSVVAAMRAASSHEVSDPVAKTFRLFAESQGNDLQAMAAGFETHLELALSLREKLSEYFVSSAAPEDESAAPAAGGTRESDG